jgi:NADH:ubiquinone oxidoreductase subunit 4 (subunit M)
LWVSLDGDGQFQGVNSLEWLSRLELGFKFVTLGVDGVSIFFYNIEL